MLAEPRSKVLPWASDTRVVQPSPIPGTSYALTLRSTQFALYPFPRGISWHDFSRDAFSSKHAGLGLQRPLPWRKSTSIRTKSIPTKLKPFRRCSREHLI
ncbi:protein of unknown function [Methylorubrum extorquens]|uniref:Uncharacterized protein n=1 Tax=Methylorubrum extorquens TaxID=408 RepID=A0A2N9AHS3_METEX|nr:protein of unknown function [Methylorubrum extorquens]